MITEEPEEWSDPLSHLFEEPIRKFEALFGQMPTFDSELVRARTPSGTIIEMPRREFDSKVAVGLSLTEVEDE